jgi:hypothetical protein
MKRNRKLRRAQPRKATPPVSFRTAGGERIILMLDEEFTTTAPTSTSSRQPVLLSLAPGLRISLQSRRIQKRRYPALRIEVVSKVG